MMAVMLEPVLKLREMIPPFQMMSSDGRLVSTWRNMRRS